MARLLERILQCYPRPYITDVELGAILKGTADGRYGKVKRLLADGKLLHVRRGLYCLTDKVGYLTKPHPYELAQYIYGPSYISLESALSFHKLIPEAVYTVTSVTIKRFHEFQTPLGLFSYLHLPPENFFIQVELIKENGYQFFMATPWKAMCDYVFCYRKDDQRVTLILDSLRINFENLPELSYETIQSLDEYYHQARMSRFLRGIPR